MHKFSRSMFNIAKPIFILLYISFCIYVILIDPKSIPNIDLTKIDRSSVIAFLATLPIIYTIMQTAKSLDQNNGALAQNQEALQQNKEALEQTKLSVLQNHTSLEQNKEALAHNEKSINIAIKEFESASESTKEQIQISIKQLNESSRQFNEQHEFDKHLREGEMLMSLYNSTITEIQNLLKTTVQYNLISTCELPSFRNIPKSYSNYSADLKCDEGGYALAWTAWYLADENLYSDALMRLEYNESSYQEEVKIIGAKIANILSSEIAVLIEESPDIYQSPKGNSLYEIGYYKSIMITDLLEDIMTKDGEKNEEIASIVDDIFRSSLKYSDHLVEKDSKKLKLSDLFARLPLRRHLGYSDQNHVIISNSSIIFKYYELTMHSIDLLKKMRENVNFSKLSRILTVTNIIQIENLFKLDFIK